ncbi:MAG TPA: adenylate/guanylate cyclase domain-containing protein, partial [Acidimicrobiales bacterium]|nr:adenylate/guanylate cyclase domain-containing protein [Acidimicrobiales bacterium]
MTDGAGPAGATVGAIRALLRDQGTSDGDLDRAEADGTLALLAVERLLVPETARYDLTAVTQQTGMTAEQVQHLWRSLGFPVPRPGEVAFTDSDVEILAEVGQLVADDVASADLVVQMSRVIGSSVARIASAQVDVISAGTAGPARAEPLGDDRIVGSAAALLPIVPRVLASTWRRHLQTAVRRRMTLAGTTQAGVVGFADLVGFTALSQQVSDEELAAIVEQFEDLAFDVITAGGGRVVKMIGDEVMFTVDTAHAAAEIALALAEGTRRADELSDLRVGLAQGPLLERESDLYGPVVNLASRVTGIAFPGTIVVSESV